MSTQVRDRRKKTFKMKERREVEQSSTGTDGKVGKQEETSTLNIRRSSRKPKPRKYDDDDDDDYVSTGQETTEKASESGDVDASIKSDEPEMAASSGILSGSGVKRETRKTYQNYLETLGYHTDFSKISSPEPVKQSVKGKVGSGQINTAKQLKQTKQSKSEEKIITEQLFPTNLINDPSTRVRTSSRTPKPKKTFALLEDNSTTHTKDSDSIIPQHVGVMSPETGIKSPKIGKGKTASSENFSQSEKPFKGRTRATSSMVHDSSSTMPLSKHDVDQAELLFDPEDSGQLRTSARVRIPKRKFSLIEELPSSETKRQKLMSPEHSADVEVCGDKELQDKVEESNDESLQTQSSLVIKRSGRKKQKRNSRKGDPRGSCMPTDKEKVEHLSKKMDKSHIDLETEKKSESRRVKQRMEKEPIVPKLKISKDSAVVKDSKKNKKNKDKEDEDQTYNSRKHLKRKRGNSDLEKSASEKEEKEVKNDGKEHIVLKLTIPHGSPKTDENEKGHEKHHKHHHHHKHKKEKKESESDTKKKNKSDGEDLVPESKETSDKDLKVMETVIKGKKKKKKKEETSESLSSDNSAVPHVKLVIKKSPIKQKDETNASKSDPLKINKPSSQDSDDQNIRSDKPKSKAKSSKKEDKPTPKSPKKRIKKDVKVSAYSLFTKSRRKNLLEKEPNLDFASTSRRLADMWRELSLEDKEYWRLKAQAIRKANSLKQKAGLKGYKGNSLSRKGCQDSDSASHSKESDVTLSSGTDAVDMAAYLKLLGESLCSIGMCLKRQDQMEVHGSLSVLLDTALCSIVPLFCLTSQLPELAGCSPETQAQILDNLAYIIPGL